MRNRDEEDLLRPATEEERKRLNEVWTALAGPGNYFFAPRDRMDLWLVEHKIRTERMVTQRLVLATWVLVFATVVLAIATIALVFVTTNLN
ncbi:hypothetical protein [Mycolicibacterium iranicum]|uniref:DUF3040 domain-containing protein n=1 Tax=Mycolicibacterium iranicum TaxID=912594 RepID=A0ABT4HBL6_MYCIR|nr:hypothetical protein [Mycolicibacterium iranicum]MCZ0727199.1 hypothetical protein [Mycolicibacterium iranicum]